MTRTTSQRCRTYSINSIGLAGLSTTPAFLPRSRICDSTPWRWIVADDFRRHEQMIGAGLGKCREIALRLDDHKMHIERLLCVASHRFDNHRSERDIRHKTTIHDIDMDPVGAGRIDGANFVGEMPEIRRQDRRCDDNRFCNFPLARAVIVARLSTRLKLWPLPKLSFGREDCLAALQADSQFLRRYRLVG